MAKDTSEHFPSPLTCEPTVHVGEEGTIKGCTFSVSAASLPFTKSCFSVHGVNFINFIINFRRKRGYIVYLS